MGDFLSNLGDALSGAGDAIVADIAAVASWLLQVIVYIGNVLAGWIQALGQYLFSALQQIGKFFVHIWDTFFKGLWTRLLKILKSSQLWNDIRHGHILAALIDLRKLMDALFTNFVRPILNMLQQIRQFLQLLKLLHVNFAAQLDAWIAQTEQRIAGAFLTIRAAVNGAIDVLTLIADPSLLLRKPTLIISLRRTLPAVIRGLTGLPPGYFFPSPRGAAGGFFAPVPANFNPADPAMNPPASFYLSQDDGIGNVSPMALGFAPADSAVDDVTLLDYFDFGLYPAPLCSNPTQCLIPLLGLPSNG
jgi:hypothetical protein